jgi:hypothetical protein
LTFPFALRKRLWVKTYRGYWALLTRTAKDRFQRTLTKIAEWCKVHRHAKFDEQQRGLNLDKGLGLRGLTRNCGARSQGHFPRADGRLPWVTKGKDTGSLQLHAQCMHMFANPVARYTGVNSGQAELQLTLHATLVPTLPHVRACRAYNGTGNVMNAPAARAVLEMAVDDHSNLRARLAEQRAELT